MYITESHTRKFDTDNVEEMADYDQILNNPLCTIISERKEKLKSEEFDGEFTTSEETIILVVTWNEKKLA